MSSNRTNKEWFTLALPAIYNISRLNAIYHDRFYITKNDILVGIKRYKYGYSGFSPPSIVLSVYECVFNDL